MAANIKQPMRYMIFEVSTYDALTPEERAMYDGYTNTKRDKNNRESARNELIKKVRAFTGIREIPEEKLYRNGYPKEEKVIARFEDECVRQTGKLFFDRQNPKELPFIEEIVILDCPENDFKNGYNRLILQQIIYNGILIAGKEYIFYSSSTNQQKNKQVCLLQRQFYEDNQSRFMCGLTLQRINENEGCNTGKYLAYTSLIFSKSVEMENTISIDDVIVLPEFETLVRDKVNFLDMEHLSITEKEMDVPVNHMDGAGIFLPGTFPCSCQIRGGWIKGAVFPFDFRQFIIEKQEQGIIAENAVIYDVWGSPIEINEIRDNIKLVLNASQLKMWKYYSSWSEYKEKFKEDALQICINNIMHYPSDRNPVVHSAYQFFQTIPRENITDEKIEKLSALTIKMINDAKTDPYRALEVMGVDIEAEGTQLSPLYACIREYPQMLQSPYVRKRMDSAVKSIRNKAMSGKPYVHGYYNYICPDLYAACEYWFCGIENPEGLIPRNHVYNALYAANHDVQEVCCLRSPHLSDCEHGIRLLARSEECNKWFCGLDTVISTHDLLTKTLQCDVDGDECLVVTDKAFIDLVDRNKLPLYYEMQKAPAAEVNNDNIFRCLMRSFQNSVIGEISNTLTKHLNMAERLDLDFVRIMTAYNNFCIDFPKSQYMPELGHYQEMFDEWKSREYPYFFKYAKDKKVERCCQDDVVNGWSNVNRISRYIQMKTRTGSWIIDGAEECFQPQYLQNPEIRIDPHSEKYLSLQKKMYDLKKKNNAAYKKKLNQTKEFVQMGYDVFYHYCNHVIMENFLSRKEAAAYLLDIEYFQPENENSNKDILWNCFGDILYHNLCNNLNVNSDIPVRRNRYQSRNDKEKVIEEKVAAVVEETQKSAEIQIYQSDYDFITNLKCRKRCEHDKYVLFILIVLLKRNLLYLEKQQADGNTISDDSWKHFKIFKRSKNGKSVTRATIDKWLGKSVAKKSLERLVDGSVLEKIVECDDYLKIYLSLPETSGDILFSVKEKNPMIDYYAYTEEAKIGTCQICGKRFIVVGNTKTCSDVCSRILTLRNKNH